MNQATDLAILNSSVLPRVESFVIATLENVKAAHASFEGKTTTLVEVDSLIRDTCELKNAVEQLKEIATKINIAIARLESRAGGMLASLGRKDYVSPAGTIKREKKWRWAMPETVEEKLELFDWMKDQDIFETYATVNAASLNALANAEWKAAIKKDPDNFVLFRLPGVPDVRLDEFTKIKPAKQKANEGDDYEQTDDAPDEG